MIQMVTPYDIKPGFMQKITFRKSTKTAATRAAVLTPICTKTFGGAYISDVARNVNWGSPLPLLLTRVQGYSLTPGIFFEIKGARR